MDTSEKQIKNSRCLVAGGRGFIGSRVVDRLLDLGAEEVVVLERAAGKKQTKKSSVRYISCDLVRDESVRIIRKLGAFDYVFNMIGVTDQRMPHPNPIELFDANVRTLIHLTQGIGWKNVRGAVHVGSNAEYGALLPPHHEDMNPRPVNVYGWSKSSASSYALMMTMAGFAKWCVARPFFVYGPGKQTGLIPKLITTLGKGESFVISGNSTRDPVYVDDAAVGLIRLAVCPEAKGEIVNICGGKEIPIRTIARMIQRNVGKGEIIFKSETRPGDMLRSHGSIKKLKALTGWSPSTTVSVGIGRILKGY